MKRDKNYIFFSQSNCDYFYEIFAKTCNSSFLDSVIPKDAFKKNLKSLNIHHDSSFIFLEGDKPLGIFLSSLHNATGYISAVCVPVEYQRQGYGSEIMNYGLTLLKQRCSHVALEVKEDNIPAIRLYKKLGFTFSNKLINFRCENNCFYNKNHSPDVTVVDANGFTFQFLYNSFHRTQMPRQKQLNVLLAGLSNNTYDLFLLKNSRGILGYILFARNDNYIEIIDIGLSRDGYDMFAFFLSSILQGERVVQAKYFYHTDPLCDLFLRHGFYNDLELHEMVKSF